MLDKRNRLSKNGSYAYVRKHGTVYHDKYLTLICVLSENKCVRVGFAVNNKIGKANVRNLVKRRMRAYTKICLPTLSGSQCVFIAKPGIGEISYEEITSEMSNLFSKAGLIKKTQDGEKEE